MRSSSSVTGGLHAKLLGQGCAPRFGRRFCGVTAPGLIRLGEPRPASGSASLPSAAFPVSVQSGDGTVRIPSRPDRILCLSASATQMLYAMGAGSQVVGVDKYSTYPPDAPRTKFTGYESSAEDYLYLRPDLVIFAFETGTLIQQLQALHIPALLLPPATSIASVDSQLAELGAATGHQAGARNVEASLQAHLSAAVRGAGAAGRGQDLLHRGRPDLLHRHFGHVHRGRVFSFRHAGHRGRRRPRLRATRKYLPSTS